jgi:hypothetical protein
MRIVRVATLTVFAIALSGCGPESDSVLSLSEACTSPASTDGRQVATTSEIVWVGECGNGSCEVLPHEPDPGDCEQGMVYNASFRCPENSSRVLLRSKSGNPLTRIGEPCPSAGFDDPSWGTRVEGVFSADRATGVTRRDAEGGAPQFDHSILYRRIEPGYTGE